MNLAIYFMWMEWKSAITFSPDKLDLGFKKGEIRCVRCMIYK